MAIEKTAEIRSSLPATESGFVAKIAVAWEITNKIPAPYDLTGKEEALFYADIFNAVFDRLQRHDEKSTTG